MEPTTNTGGPEVPEVVAREALARDLGEALDVRHEASTGTQVAWGAALSGVGVVVSLAVSSYNSAQSAAAVAQPGTTHSHLFVPSGALVLIGLALMLRGLLVGRRSHHLFTGGLVHRRRSGLRTLAWPEVREMRAVSGRDRSTVVAYRIVGSGTALTVPVRLVHGRDAFVDHVLRFMAQYDRPVR